MYYVWVSPGSAYHRRIVCGLCGAAERAISGICEFGIWVLRRERGGWAFQGPGVGVGEGAGGGVLGRVYVGGGGEEA